MHLLRKTFATVAGLSLLGSPVLAATPQQLVNQSLFTFQQASSASSDGTFEVHVTERSLIGRPAMSGSARFRLSQNVMAGSGLQNNDGTFTIERVVLPPTIETAEIQRYLNNLSISWKYIDGNIFFRVGGVAPSLLEKAKEEGVDLTLYVNRWIKVDGELMDSMKELQRVNTPGSLENSELKWLHDAVKKYPPLQLLRVERRETRTNGDKIQRMRFRVNPAFVNAIYRKGLSEIKSTGKNRTYDVQALNAQFTQLRKVTNNVAVVAVVNTTQSRVERLELGGSITEPRKTSTWNESLRRYIEKTTSMLTVKYAIGVNLRPFTGTIDVPTNFFMLTDVVKEIEAQQRTRYPLPEPMPMPVPEPLPPPTIDQPMGMVSPVAPVTAQDHVLGNPNATVTLIEYADFECPFCKNFSASLMRALAEFPNDVRVVYRHYPLSFHPQAMPAAEAAECAANLGGNTAFWGMHDKLFTDPMALGRDTYISHARSLGLNESVFASCIDGHLMQASVDANTMSGNDAGVQGTPATFVNGKLLSGAVSYDVLKEEIRLAGGTR